MNTDFYGPITIAQSNRANRAKRDETVIRHLRKYSGTKPLVIVGPFTMGVIKLHPIDDEARAVLEDMCPPSDEHTWCDGAHGYGLLVETRYANDIVAALRDRKVFVP